MVLELCEFVRDREGAFAEAAENAAAGDVPGARDVQGEAPLV